MRKIQQTKILELLQTLREATGVLNRLASPEAAAGLFTDIQNFAVQTGKYIESVEGEGTRAVSMLEDYCDLLYEAHTGNAMTAFHKRLRSAISKIEHTVRTELQPNRFEIVFFPYQLSMFDSFESIYLAAKDDPNCDVYVVPIPWYERLSNGAFGKPHYDGDEYPRHIAVTNWEEYDVEARHPDVIFIHNPYDEGNYVTTVHPHYYSKILRDCTDLLVYVPYFVTGTEDVPDEFCTTAACVYAHKTILQSEKVRDTYIRANDKSYGNRFGKPKDKFIALGSPKFDAVINGKPVDFNLPEAWRNSIFDADGAKKKVVMYNTTLAALLRENEEYLKKIKYVLSVFDERDDIALWWRPHPLMKVTLKSMRPHLLEEYIEIENVHKDSGSRVKKSSIYDETPDLNRAIAWSDAYFGDQSSLVSMYQVAGKPIMLQDVHIVSKEEDFSNRAYLPAIFDNGDAYWFSDSRFNVVCKISKPGWEMEYIGSVPGEKGYSFTGALYLQIVRVGDHLYFTPHTAKAIAVYSLKDRCFSTIPFEVGEEVMAPRHFSRAIVYENNVFFTPYSYPAILCLDTETGAITYYNDWVKPLQQRIGSVKSTYFLAPVCTGDSIMLAACGTNAVVEFDLKRRSSRLHFVGRSNYCFNGICFDSENYWLAPRYNTPVLKWNPKTNSVTEIPILDSDSDDAKLYFNSIVYSDGRVWLLPLLAEHAIKIDVHTNEATIADIFDAPTGLCDIKYAGQRYVFSQVCGESIVAYSAITASLVEYNPKSGAFKSEPIRYSQDILESLKPTFDELFLQNADAADSAIFRESDFTSVNLFLDYITQADEVKKTNDGESNTYGAAGKAIYDYVKKLILRRK